MEFYECDMRVGTTGFLAETVSLSLDNSLQATYANGFAGQIQTPSGPTRGSLQVEYLVKPDSEPIFGLVTSLKNSYLTGVHPVSIDFGGLSINAYLDSFSLRSSPNQGIRANANFQFFNTTIGNNLTVIGGYAYPNTGRHVAHGWTTFITAQDDYLTTPTYEFSYDFKLNIEPLYILGQKAPLQVNIDGGSETVEIVRDRFYPINFTGQLAREAVFNAAPTEDKDVVIRNLYYSWDSEFSHSMEFNLQGARINNSKVSAKVGELVKGSTTIIRSF
jgi:hypothetical protein